TIESGTRAAVTGGFTSVLCMPNTTPVNDSPSVTREILAAVKKKGACHVYPVGAISRGLKGEELSPMKKLRAAGCVAFSDDGRPVNNAQLMREALSGAKSLKVPVIEHCEELTLSEPPTIHEGAVARELGFSGVSISAETTDVVRTLMLAAEVGGRVHLAHL